jgi:hypothetical protein
MEDAISITVILHAEDKGKLYTGPKIKNLILKILRTLCRMSAPLVTLVYDPLRGSIIEYA